MSMANRYNSSVLPAEVLVNGSAASLVRTRENFSSLIEHELTTSPISLDCAAREVCGVHAS
jgi:hypothetical protein